MAWSICNYDHDMVDSVLFALVFDICHDFVFHFFEKGIEVGGSGKFTTIDSPIVSFKYAHSSFG